MKKSILLTFLFASMFTIRAQTKAVISGKIINSAVNEISIIGLYTSQKINLGTDGSFKTTLALDYEGQYYFHTGLDGMSIYLENGKTLIINADYKNLFKTLKFQGTLAKENQYLAAKSVLLQKTDQKALYTLGENDFLASIAKTAKSRDSLYKSSDIKNTRFKKLEERDQYYATQYEYWIYPEWHKDIAQLPDYKSSESFPTPEKSKMVFDNQDDFTFSNVFMDMARRSVQDQPNLAQDTTTVHKLPFEKIKRHFKSPVIRDAMFAGFGFFINAGNPNSEIIYKKLMEEIKSEVLKKDITQKFTKLASLLPGKPAPSFDLENLNGSRTTMENLKGKYIYIDFWATWCKPCREEIPALKEIQAKYNGKNVEFVSISIDNVRDKEKWQNLVKKENLQGVQLIDGLGFNSKLVASYIVESIPRFILIDSNGSIVSADAPRPSDPELSKLLDALPL
ncbi:TlpA disulfide reductase family protein [Flavobacterium sp.]|uniref:TlpA family protein disulfide reductase n=1 Tax=Flavobacterium sp. TaxID=239 RepID=UPI0025C393F5|nr:TlpA disulfide reductase family protein [Flavobacterium sp.]